MHLAEAHQRITQLFDENKILDPQRESEVFLRQLLNLSVTQFVLEKKLEIKKTDEQSIFNLAKRRAGGEPLAYLVGYKDFFKSRFYVDSSVLIPRPETELLVEEALKLSPQKKMIDIGSGSGCIGLSLLQEWPDSLLTAVDISDKALNITQKNAKQLNLENRVELFCGEIETYRAQNKFDLVVSNPPYISRHDQRLDANVKKYEPSAALFAEDDGLLFYKSWTVWAHNNLKADGWLIYEVGEGQAGLVQSICLQNGFKNIKIIKDLSDIERVIVAQRSAHG
ncbi:peptide chain release factor N(5)-glutamine methyltransferase [bacterium]|nr:peptide chain release factor N(5)-glutamine methyltransferase [bacterium]